MSRPLATSPSHSAPSWKLPSLRERLERARRPGASISDVDDLIAGLSPSAVTEAMTPREHADLLYDILRDLPLSRRTDRRGREVRHVASEALLALGYPYAMELPAEALPSPHREPLTGWSLLGPVLVMCAGLAEWKLLALFRASVNPPRPPLPSLGPGVAYCGTTSTPPFITEVSIVAVLLALGAIFQGVSALAVLGQGSRTARTWGAWAQWTSGALRGGLFALFWFMGSGYFGRENLLAYATSIVLLTTGAVMGLAGFCLRPSSETR